MDLQITNSLFCYKTQKYFLITYSSFLLVVFQSQANIFCCCFCCIFSENGINKKDAGLKKLSVEILYQRYNQLGAGADQIKLILEYCNTFIFPLLLEVIECLLCYLLGILGYNFGSLQNQIFN